MLEPFPQPDLFEAGTGACGIVAAIFFRHQRRHEDVFKNGALRQQAMILKDEPDAGVSEIRQRGGGEIERILPIEGDGPLRRRLECAEHVQQRTLTAA